MPQGSTRIFAIICLYFFPFTLQSHTAIGRALEALQKMYFGMKFLKETLSAYFHFEALGQHAYDAICNSCGSEPKVLVLDGNRKCAFKLPGKWLSLLQPKWYIVQYFT
jgi:hypothetical protein